MNPQLISLIEAAEYLGIEPSTLRKWVQKKQILFYRIGIHPKFKLADLDKFIEARCVPPVKRMKEPKLRLPNQRRAG